MIRRSCRKILLSSLVAAFGLFPLASHACSVCYGDPDSGMSKGLVWGISAMLVVVVSVLAGVSTFFVYVAKKSPRDKDKE